MAWTQPPRTWTDGELVTASIMNAHVRDQFNQTSHFVSKSADENVVASTTLQDDDHLRFAMATNETYAFHLNLWSANTSTGDIKFTFTVPASATYMAVLVSENAAGTFAYQNIRSASDVPDANSATTGSFATIFGVVQNAGTAGNLQLQWACNSAAGTTTLKKGSTMWYGKVA